MRTSQCVAIAVLFVCYLKGIVGICECVNNVEQCPDGCDPDYCYYGEASCVCNASCSPDGCSDGYKELSSSECYGTNLSNYTCMLTEDTYNYCQKCLSGYYGNQCTPCDCGDDEECDDGINGTGTCTSLATSTPKPTPADTPEPTPAPSQTDTPSPTVDSAGSSQSSSSSESIDISNDTPSPTSSPNLSPDPSEFQVTSDSQTADSSGGLNSTSIASISAATVVLGVAIGIAVVFGAMKCRQHKAALQAPDVMA